METLVTSDIYLVSALLSKGAEIKTPINTNDPRHFKFTIIGERIDEMKKDWVDGIIEGNLVEFSRILKNMKQLLHETGE